ncbi:MSC_0620 family F1-like ATPase-associated subunit [Mesomycoplasma neurolyticum]|uniref:Transmembrane protein n=1 Tax=Mesomycoplasma neurolyticum TaxID=2120 RepID=A0A449A4I1_9BACT|nr:hypothetical protein [Mesomycoplasma neurolyticum]VEU59190.1 Uncharacterised protein [Mesomycoplasma neurolyticum]
MRRKTKNILLKFSYLSIIPMLTPFVTLSAELKDEDKNNIKKMFDDAIKAAIEQIEKYKNNISETSESLTIENLFKIYYLENLLLFLKQNQNAITDDPNSFGFNTVFFNNILEKKSFNKITIKIDDNEYTNVINSNDNSEKYDYLKHFSNSINKINESDVKNEITDEQKTTIFNRYAKQLGSEFFKILFNENDFPNFSNKEFIKFKTLTQEDGKQLSSIVPNFINDSSLENYFRTKYSSRFVEFDLKQNFIDDKNEEQTEEKEEEKKDNLEKPSFENILSDNPNVINDKKIDISNINDPRRLRILTPNIKPKYITQSFNELRTEFLNSNDENKSEKFFFFDNPILTKYRYDVTKIEDIDKDDGKETAWFYVKISEIEKPDNNRIYKVKIFKTNATKEFQIIYEKSIEVIKEIYLKLYNSLNIGKEMKFTNIPTGVVRNELFNFIINSADNIYYFDNKKGKSFEKIKIDFFNKFSKKIQNTNLQSVLKNFENEWSELYLNTLKNTEYNQSDGINIFNTIVIGFEKDINYYEQLINDDKYDFKTNIQELFKKNNGDPKIINELFSNIKKDIKILKKHTTWKTFDILSWYDKYIQNLNKITKKFQIITNFLKLSSDLEQKNPEILAANLNFEDVYETTHQVLTVDKTTKKTFSLFLGILLIIVSFILFITTLIKVKTLKISSKKNIAFLSSSIFILILGIILIALKFIGGIF